MKRLLLILAASAALLAAGCTTLMKGESALRSGNYQEAVTHFKARVAENPSDWQSREKLGYALLNAGDPKAAVVELEKVPNTTPPKEGSLAPLYLGLAYLKMDNPDAALKAWASYKDKSMPLVKAEIDRLTTLVEIEASKKAAKAALAQERSLSASAVKPDSYAVFNFGVQSQEPSMRSIQKALTAMTIADLAQVKGISVIERVRLQALLDEMKLGQTGAVDAATAPKAGKLLGADNLVVGSLNDPSGKVGVVSSTASTTRGAVVGSFSVSQDKDKFYELQKAVVANILKVGNIKLDADTEAKVLKEYHTRSFQAVSFYGQGLDAQDRGDFQASKDYFALAVKEDPNFKLASAAYGRSPAGISVGIKGPVGDVATKALAASVVSQSVASSSGVGKASLGGGGPGGGSGGHGGGSCS